MSMTNSCNCRCSTAALIASLFIGVIAAFLQITGIISVSTIFLWVTFGIAVLYLAILILAASREREEHTCGCLCANLRALLAGILGTILFALVLLLIDVAEMSVIGAILVGLLLFFFTLLLTGAACLIRCRFDCGD